MKLRDLNPRWLSVGQGPYEIKHGIAFDCPHCETVICPTCGHTPKRKRLAVNFQPAIYDATAMSPEAIRQSLSTLYQGTPHVRIGGETFDDLTLSPSIGFDEIGHWHGRLTNGEIQ